MRVEFDGIDQALDEAHKDEVGLYFEPEGGQAVKAEIVAVNEPRQLKVIVPQSLYSGQPYTLKVVTMSSAKNGAALLKNIREVRSEFTLTTQ